MIMKIIDISTYKAMTLLHFDNLISMQQTVTTYQISIEPD